jgi:DNA-binding NtrC family response regulator
MSHRRGFRPNAGVDGRVLLLSSVVQRSSATSQSIAVVDDDQELLDLLGGVLRDEGYAIVLCRDWRTAYATLRAAPPDLLILDIRMHGAPDWFVFDEVIADPVLALIPRIVCSALVPVEQWSGPAAASGRYVPLVKPFDLEELLGLVRQLLLPGSAVAPAS